METYDLFKTAFGDKYLCRLNTFIWLNKFSNGCESVDDERKDFNFQLVDQKLKFNWFDTTPTLITNEDIPKFRNLGALIVDLQLGKWLTNLI